MVYRSPVALLDSFFIVVLAQQDGQAKAAPLGDESNRSKDEEAATCGSSAATGIVCVV
jgi:hypothetical protein